QRRREQVAVGHQLGRVAAAVLGGDRPQAPRQGAHLRQGQQRLGAEPAYRQLGVAPSGQEGTGPADDLLLVVLGEDAGAVGLAAVAAAELAQRRGLYDEVGAPGGGGGGGVAFEGGRQLVLVLADH